MLFQLLLILATLSCGLVAGFLFAFAVVVMPGTATLSDDAFLRAFQVIDGVIQRNHPLFILVWVGSAIVLLAATVVGFGQLDGAGRLLLGAAVLVYLVGVQLPTIAINVPLNNKVQTIETEALDEPTLAAARQDFEPRWNRWNTIRTWLATLVSVLLLAVLLRL